MKCKKNIKDVSDSLRGTVFQVDSPAFLLLQPRPAEDEDTEDVFGEEEYVDDDLEILIEEPPEKDKEIEFGEDDSQDELRLEPDETQTEEEEEDREIEIDFSQFEDSQDEESAPADEEVREEKSFSLEMPEALADISDLAPPARMAEAEKEPAPAAKSSSSEPDLELDFDLGLDDLELSVPGSPEETELALDDLDFSETLSPGTSKAPAKASADMDEELNFDLDLGGLSIHKDQ